MNSGCKGSSVIQFTVALLLTLAVWPLSAATPEQLLQQLNDYPHAQVMASSDKPVIDYEIGLSAIRKVRGTWSFKDSQRWSGQLTRYTWQIVDGFTSQEVMQGLEASLEREEGAALVFSCDGRSCGQGAQWANRVFRQRVLYGREDLQRYRVYALLSPENTEYRLVIYSGARTADRQYLHVELLRIEE